MVDIHERGGDEYKPRYFTAAEWRFVNAACGRLIPNDDLGPGAVELAVPEFIDRHMTTPYAAGELWYRVGPYFDAPAAFGYQGPLAPRDIIRLGIAGTDAYCEDNFRRPFCLLALEKNLLPLAGVNASHFFSMLLSEARAGFFADPVHGGNRNMEAWRLIGYPGLPEDYRNAVTVRDEPYSAESKSFAHKSKF
jgi:gluconate 2-dehydrogenase gamma chain